MSVTLAMLVEPAADMLTMCTMGVMEEYTSHRWSGEREVSVMVHRRPRACTSFLSAKSASVCAARHVPSVARRVPSVAHVAG